MSTSLTDRGMDHGPFQNQDCSGLEVVLDDMPQAARIPIDTALVSRLRWDGVPPSLHTVLARTLTSTRQGKAPCPGPKLAVVQRRCLPPRKPPAHCQTCQQHAERPPLEDTLYMSRRSAFLSSLLDKHSSPHADTWFIGCRCRVSASVHSNSYSL